MNIIGAQLWKLRTFFFILFSLYILNVFFNMKFLWTGISLIVRVYIFVLSFYVVFVFSQLNIRELKEIFSKVYGRRGKLYLFLQVRAIPFLIIYAMTWIFIFTNHVTLTDWPAVPFFRIMDGRFSNTLFYCLILSFIIKQNRRPSIAIPQFIIYSIIFFTIDKSLYSFFDSGYGVGGIKFFKYVSFSFFMLFEFSDNRRNIFKFMAVSVAGAAAAFMAIIAVTYLFFRMTSPGSYTHDAAASLLMKSGCSRPVSEISSLIMSINNEEKLENLVHYARLYRYRIDLSDRQWETVLRETTENGIESVFEYFTDNGINFDFQKLTALLLFYSENGKIKDSSSMPRFRSYFSMHLMKNWDIFVNLYISSNTDLKRWLLLSLENIKKKKAAYFLLGKLSDGDRQISETAYLSLKKITGQNPMLEYKAASNDLRVIFFFRKKLKEIYRR